MRVAQTVTPKPSAKTYALAVTNTKATVRVDALESFERDYIDKTARFISNV